MLLLLLLLLLVAMIAIILNVELSPVMKRNSVLVSLPTEQTIFSLMMAMMMTTQKRS
jgi:hypothetical protein